MNDPLYSKLGIKYQQAYSGPYHDLSLKIDGCRLVIGLKRNRITGFGRPCVCFGEHEDIARQFRKIHEGTKGFWYMDYLENGLHSISRYLLECGYTPSVYMTHIIDCGKDEQMLFREVRKSYKNLIHKYQPVLSDISTLKEIHIEVCGRQTRSDDTWQIQQEMIDQGQGFCLSTHGAAAFFMHTEECAYYGVGASHNDVYSHPLIWYAIMECKKRGVRFLEMGEQLFHGQDTKALGIAKFKRGFGGVTKVRFIFQG